MRELKSGATPLEDGWIELTGGDLIEAARLVRASPPPLPGERLRKALEGIAAQKLECEMEVGDALGSDWQGGFEHCVRFARKVLASSPTPAPFSPTAENGPDKLEGEALGWNFDMQQAPRECLIFTARWGVTEGLRFEDKWGVACFNGQVIRIVRGGPIAWQPKPLPPATASLSTDKRVK